VTDIANLSLIEIRNQLQILEYIATNTREGLTEGDREFLRQLEEQEQRLLRLQGGAA
jgi:hypothetical protein